MQIFGMRIGKTDPITKAIDEAIDLLEEQEFDEAIRVLREKGLGRNPEHRRTRLHLGIAYMLKGDLDEAESVIRPLTEQRHMDSEKAAAEIALEKIASDRAKKSDG